MLLTELVDAVARVGATRARTAKVQELAALLRAAGPEWVATAVALVVGQPRQGRLGVGWRTVDAVRPPVAPAATLTLADVDLAFDRLAAAGGAGSAAERHATLESLFVRATTAEREHLTRVLIGEVRSGALEGVLTDAVAVAAGLSRDVVRRAAMLTGDLGLTARRALAGEDLSAVTLTPGIPVLPMLAGTAPTAAAAVAQTGLASVEHKLDGMRLQVHRVDGVVTAYSRSLADVTARVPEVVTLVQSFPGGDLVLDGETLALDEEGAARPFQDSMSGGHVLSVWFFDALVAEGRTLIDEPLELRREVLARVVGEHVVRGRVTAEPDEAQAELNEALAAGHEGIVVKSVEAPYAAGRRGANWVKVKPVHTYDLVVLGVEWGSGRRAGTLSNIHLGALDPDGQFGKAGGFVMVGKTFKGMTDEILAWQTEFFPTVETGRSAYGITVAPTTVVEIAIDGVQRSSRYPGGVALRFARVKRYRVADDLKAASEATTIGELRALLPGGPRPD